MRSTALSLVFSLVSLGGVAYVALEIGDLEDEMRSLSRQPATDARRAVDIEAGAGAPQEAQARPVPARPGEAVAASSRESLAAQVARLEREQKELRGELEAARHGPPADRPWRPFPHRSFARNVDELAQTLQLTPTQKVRVQDAVDRGRRRVEEVLKIPDETGKSPHERRQEQHKKITEALQNREQGALLSLPLDLSSYREKKIPGRNETYGQELDRITKETREEIASGLDATQQETLAQTDVAPLLGAGGGVSFMAFASEGGEGGGHAIAIETAVEGRIVEPSAPPPKEKGDGE